jgi:hypothetical protein
LLIALPIILFLAALSIIAFTISDNNQRFTRKRHLQ